jgi:hypothetical protein
MRQGCIVLLGILFLLFIIGRCSSNSNESANQQAVSEETATESPAPVSLADLEKKLSEHSIEVMTQEDYSETYSKLGSDSFKRANDLAKWAGIVAAESASCDRVDIVAISDRSTRSELQWYVDCVNGERFRPSETQAKAAKAKWQGAKGSTVAVQDAAKPQSASLANISEVDAVTMCDLAVKEAMKSKSSFDTAWSWQFRRHPEEGRISVIREFEAENSFGANLSSEYRCIIDAASRSFIEIAVREPTGWEVIYAQ